MVLTAKRVLKRSESGMEVEYHIINSSGKISNKADFLIKKINSRYPQIDLTTESFQNVIEYRSFPEVRLRKGLPRFLTNLKHIAETAEKHDLMLYPFAMYPRPFKKEKTKKERYDIAMKVYGKELFYTYSPLCAGFHYHYTLPWGVFDSNKKFLKPLRQSKVKRTLIDAYNLLIASDPALTTFMQSSPFYKGRYLAKDSRLLIYRGSHEFEYKDRLFKGYEIVKALPRYVFTGEDLIQRHLKMDKFWKEKMREVGLNKEAKKKQILDYVWCPVKINKIGTVEERGMDVNYPSYLVATSVMLKYILRQVQQEFFKVVPSDIGIKEPFKIEGENIYVPPHSYVRNNLQKDAAWKGLESKPLYNHCKKFLKFARKCILPDYSQILKPIKNIIDSEKTVSDELISYVKKKGFSKRLKLSKEVTRSLALHYSNKLVKDIDKTIEAVPQFE